MSKKRDNVDMDDIQFDDFGDFNEGGFDGQEPKAGSRKPVVTLKGSFVSGVKDGILDPSNQMAFARKALPKGYSQTLDFADKTTTELKGLYDYAAKEAEPAIKGMKKLTRNALPGIEGKLPKGLVERLKSWSEETNRGGEQMDAEESEISMTLGTIFNAHQQKMQAMQEAESERQEVRDMVQAKQAKDQIAFLQDISNNLIRQTSYQDNITAQYQQKSLELQYRSYFVQRKTLDAAEKLLGITESSMKDIVHNTSLPDILKEHNIEKAQEILKRKWLGEMTSSTSAWFSSIGKKVIGKAKTDIKQFFADFGAGIEGAASTAEMTLDQAKQNQEMTGESIDDFGNRFFGESLGGMFANLVADKVGAPRLKKYLDARSGRGEGLLRAIFSNKGQIFANFLKENSGKNAVINWLEGAVGQMPTKQTLVSKKIDQADLDQRHYWTLQNSKTLNEIIPGWLSKIHYEIKRHGTFAQGGKEAANQVEAEHFHWGSGRFETESEYDRMTAKEMENSSVRKDYAGKYKALAAALIPEPGLSPDASMRVLDWAVREIGKNSPWLDLTCLIQPEEAGDLVARAVGKRYAEEVRTYYQEQLSYDASQVKWDFDGRGRFKETSAFKKKFLNKLSDFANLPPVGNINRVTKINDAYQTLLKSERGFSLEKALDIEMRGIQASASLERLKFTKRTGDAHSAERHLNENTRTQMRWSRGALAEVLADYDDKETIQAYGLQMPADYDERTKSFLEGFTDRENNKQYQKWLNTRTGKEWLHRAEAYKPNTGKRNAMGSIIAGTAEIDDKKAYAAWIDFNQRKGRHDKQTQRANGGEIFDGDGLMFAKGGQVPGVGHATADDVNAKLSKGEYVVRKEATKIPGVLPLLRFINSLGAKPAHGPNGGVGAGESYAFAKGGTPGAKTENLVSTWRTEVNEQLSKINESMGDLVTLFGNMHTRPIITISAGQLGQFPDLKLTDLSSIEDLAIKGSRKVGKGAQWIWDKATSGVSTVANFGWNTTKTLGGFLKGAGTAAGQTIKNWWEDTSDIFVKGEPQAKLKASVMKAGGYIDVKTGKVIESLKDITGEVVDLSGKKVLEFSDFAKGLHDSHFRRALSWVKDRGNDAFNIAKIPFKLLNSGKEFFHDVLDMPDDIYVEGDNPWHPRLYARKFRDEAYINAKGEVIKRVGQIDGPVFDKAYPDNPVLYEHELGKICDFNHEPVVGLGGRVRAKMKEAAKGLFKIPGHILDAGMGVAAWAADRVAGAFNWLKGGFQSGQFNIGFGVFSTGATTVTRLEQLWVLLNARLPGKKYKRPEDFGQTQAIMPKIMKVAGESKGWFGKWRNSMDEKSKLAKEMAQAKKEAAAAYLEQQKNRVFDFIGNQNVKRNARKQAAADFVGPMPQSAAAKALSTASAKVQNLLGDKGSKAFWTNWYNTKLESLQTNHPELHDRIQKLGKVDLRKVPKDMRAKYDDVMTRFKASGSITDLEEVVRLRESMASAATTAKTTAQMVGHNVAAAASAGGSKVKSKAISAGDQLKGTLKGVTSALQAGSLQDKLMRVEGFAALQEYAKEHGSPAMKYMLLGDIDVTNGVSLRDALTAFDHMAKLTDAETEMITKFMNKPEVKAIYKHHAKSAKLSAGKAKLQSAATAVQGAVTGALDSAKGFFNKDKTAEQSAETIIESTKDTKDPDQLIANAEYHLGQLAGVDGFRASIQRDHWKRELKRAKKLKASMEKKAKADEERMYKENGRMIAQAIRDGMTLEEVNKIPGFFARHSANVSASISSKKKAFLKLLGGKSLVATGKSRAELQIEALDRAEAKRQKKLDKERAKVEAKEAKLKAKEAAKQAKEAAKADAKAWKAKQGKLAMGIGTPEDLERYRRQKMGAVGRWMEDRKKNGGGGLFDALGFRRGSKEDQEAEREKKEKSGLFHDMTNAFKKGWGRGAEGRAERKEGAKNKLMGALTWMKDFFSKDGLMKLVGGVQSLFETFTGGLGKAFSLIKAISKINVGAKVMGALRTVGTVARGAAMMGMSGLGTLASGAVAAGSAALGFIFSPVGLAVGAVAAVGYYAYKRYQNAKWDDWPIAKFRLQQYGVDPTDKDKAAKIALLEEKVATITVCAKGQQATLQKGMDASELTTIFGIDPNDKEAMNRWVIWFTRRFKPIWLTHATVFVNLTGKNVSDINRADKMMKTDTKLEYLKDVHFKGEATPYDVMQSPFAGEETLTHWKLDNDSSWVNGKYDDAVEQVKKNKEDNDAEFAVSGDPKKLAEYRKKKEAESITGRIKSMWDWVKHPYEHPKQWEWVKNASNALSNNESFQKVGDFFTGKTALPPEVEALIAKGVKVSKSLVGSKIDNFRAVMAAAAKAGDPHPALVAAQWAVESGWGSRESGKYNYFGIKATGNEPGTMVPTHEVYNGKRVAVTAKFRDYNSLEDGIAGRVNFIAKNPRYRKAGYYDAKTPFEAATALLRAHYATDPQYATTLSKVMLTAGVDPTQPSTAAPTGPASPALNAKAPAPKPPAGASSTPAPTAVAAAAKPATKAASSPVTKVADKPKPNAVTKVASTTDTVKAAATPVASAKSAMEPTNAAATNVQASFDKALIPVARTEPDTSTAPSPVSPDAIMQAKLDLPVPAARTEPDESKIPSDVMMIQDANEKAMAQAAAEKKRDEAINNTAGGIDGVVQLMRENVKLAVSMDRSLTEINQTLKQLALREMRGGDRDDSSPAPTSRQQPRDLVANAQQTNRPPVSVSKGRLS